MKKITYLNKSVELNSKTRISFAICSRFSCHRFSLVQQPRPTGKVALVVSVCYVVPVKLPFIVSLFFFVFFLYSLARFYFAREKKYNSHELHDTISCSWIQNRLGNWNGTSFPTIIHRLTADTDKIYQAYRRTYLLADTALDTYKHFHTIRKYVYIIHT